MADIWLTPDALVNLLGVGYRAVMKAIAAKRYTVREVPGGRGGKGGVRYEVLLSSLPEKAIEKWKQQQAEKVLAGLDIPVEIPLSDGGAPAPRVGPQSGQGGIPTQSAGTINPPAEATKTALAMARPSAELSQKQRERARCRERVLRFVAEFHGTMAEAVAFLNARHLDGSLEGAMRYALEHCNDRPRKECPSTGSGRTESGRAEGLLALSTVKKWKAIKEERGGLAPRKSRKTSLSIEPWHKAAVDLYSRPQKPTLRWVEGELRKAMGRTAPSYDRIQRFFREKYSQGDLIAGRHTGMALRARQFYQTRTTAGLYPADEVHADGICTKFTAPHPVTGEYVTYEVWDFHDLATRYVPPVAIGLSENFEVIAKGLENCIRELGVMKFLQTDSTKIVKDSDKFTRNPATAIAERAGITIVHPPIVGNAQDNGIPENFHKWFNNESKELATFQGKDMDDLVYRRTKKITGAAVKAQARGDMEEYHKLTREAVRTAKGLLFCSTQEAFDWIEKIRQKWNAKPHRALKKVRDPETGRMRHQTPNEALAEHKANGWEPVMLTEDEIVDLFRPHVLKKVRRGTVRPYGQMRYRHVELDHWEGQEVVVGYDIMDWASVTVKTHQGELICVASHVESIAHRPVSAQEDATIRRANATIKRNERKNQTIRDRAGLLLDGAAGDVIPLKITDLVPVSVEDDEPKTVSLREVAPQPVEDEEDKEKPLDYGATVALLYGGKDKDEDDDREAAAE